MSPDPPWRMLERHLSRRPVPLWSERPVAEPVLAEAVGRDLGFGQRVVGPVGLLVAEPLVAEGDAVDDVDELGDEIRLGGTGLTAEMSPQLAWEPAEDALQHYLVLVGQVAAGLLVHGGGVGLDGRQDALVGLRAADTLEEVGESDAAVLARRALAAGLHAQEPGHAGGHRGQVDAVVEDDEAA